MGSFAAGYEVSRRYAGDGSLRLECRSSHPRQRCLRFKRRSVGDGSTRFGRRSSQLRHYSGDRSLRLGRRTSQRQHGGLRTNRRPPRHVSRSNQTAAPARRSYQRGCPIPPPPGHAVAIPLRCGKADTEAPRSRVKLDPAFPRNSGGRSTLFPVKEEPTRLATASPFPNRSAGRKPDSVEKLVPPTGGPLLKASTGSAGPLSPPRTLSHVRSAPTATVEQDKPDTARRASGDSTACGQINRTVIPLNAQESQLSSSRTGSQPPALLGLR